jgi:hypothetical protein
MISWRQIRFTQKWKFNGASLFPISSGCSPDPLSTSAIIEVTLGKFGMLNEICVPIITFNMKNEDCGDIILPFLELPCPIGRSFEKRILRVIEVQFVLAEHFLEVGIYLVWPATQFLAT